MKPVTVSDASGALREQARATAENKPFKVVLISTQLPDIEGFDLAEAILSAAAPPPCIVMLAGAGAMIEMIYHLQLNSAMGDEVPFAGVTLHARSAMSWGVSAVLFAVGAFVLDRARRRYAEQWGEVQSEIENAARKAEGSAP